MKRKECLSKLVDYCLGKRGWDEISERANLDQMVNGDWYIWPDDTYCSGAIMYYALSSSKDLINTEIKQSIDSVKHVAEKIQIVIDVMLLMITQGIVYSYERKDND